MLQNVTGEIGGKTEQDKNRPQTDRKKGATGRGKRDTRKGSQKVSVFPRGRAGALGAPGPQ